MAAYCDLIDIEDLLQLKFTDSSKPTVDRATVIMEEIASEIRMRLSNADATYSEDNEDAKRILRLKNAQGAAAIINLTFYKNANNIQDSLPEYWLRIYREFLKEIQRNPGILSGKVKQPVLGNIVTQNGSDVDNYTKHMIKDNYKE